jgi:S1-C subfamily serine protease
MRHEDPFTLSSPGATAPGPRTMPGTGGSPPPPPRPPRYSARRRGLLSHLAVAALAAAVAAGVTVAVDHPAAPSSTIGQPSLPGASAVPVPGPAAGAVSRGTAGEQAVVNKVEPGLVVITTTQQYNSQAGAATGMVISQGGLVLTNNHVIAGATKITATALGTGRAYPARVVGYDKTGDIALIQLQGASGLRTVPVGNSAAVRRGDTVVALGNAEGQGTVVPAAGQVTGLGQTITASDQGGAAATETLHGMIQTSADIVPGDSGGPLVSAAGKVIGMDTAGSSISFAAQTSPAGFAIPINTALAVARQIAAGRAGNTITIGYPPFLGIFIGSGTSPSPQVQAQQQEAQNGFGDGFGGFGGFNGFGGLASPQPPPACYTSNASLSVPSAIAPAAAGTLVDGTICGSPAAAAGMTGGSVITAVNGTPVGSPASLTGILSTLRPGDKITVTWVSPAGQHLTSGVQLTAGPPQ